MSSDSGPARNGRAKSAARGYEGDLELVRLAKAGDRDALNKLFRKHYRDAFGYAYKLTRCPETAEDITQSGFLKLWSYLPKFKAENDASFRAILFVILKRTNLKRLKALNCRIAEVKVIKSEKLGEIDALEYMDRVPDIRAASNPFRAALGGEIASEVLRCLREELTPMEAIAFELEYAKGLTPKEISERIGRTHPSALLTRARKKMRPRLEGFR